LASWIALVLGVAYPALIVFALLAIFGHKTKHRFARYHLEKIGFWLVLGVSAVNAFQ
jgi:hypothetical protein